MPARAFAFTSMFTRAFIATAFGTCFSSARTAGKAESKQGGGNRDYNPVFQTKPLDRRQRWLHRPAIRKRCVSGAAQDIRTDPSRQAHGRSSGASRRYGRPPARDGGIRYQCSDSGGPPQRWHWSRCRARPFCWSAIRPRYALGLALSGWISPVRTDVVRVPRRSQLRETLEALIFGLGDHLTALHAHRTLLARHRRAPKVQTVRAWLRRWRRENASRPARRHQSRSATALAIDRLAVMRPQVSCASISCGSWTAPRPM